MKSKKHLSLAIVALLAISGLWFAWSAWHNKSSVSVGSGVGQQDGTRFEVETETQTGRQKFVDPADKSADRNNNRKLVTNANADSESKAPLGTPKSGRTLRPPNPSRRFVDFTPEQRVQFARQGHGPGG